MGNYLFSIITVAYNAESTIGRTMISVGNQTYENYEHIIIDGASTDRTLDIVKEGPRASKRIVVSEPDSGLYDAMNKGLGMAKGKYIIFLNSGDTFHSEDTLAKVADIIEESHPGIVYGQTDLVDISGRFIAKRHLSAPENLKLKDFSQGMLVCHQAFIVKKSIAPYFNLKYKLSADYEWCIICLQHSQKNVYAGDVLIDFLVDGLSTNNRRKSLIERFKIMSTYFGFWPTFFRHFSFIGRFVRHNNELKKAYKS